MKMIRMDEVRKGDIVGRCINRQIRVNHVNRVKRYAGDIHNGVPGGIGLFSGGSDGLCLVAAPDELIALLYRPRPEGMTEEQALAAVERCARRYAGAIADAEAIKWGSAGAKHDHLENPEDVLVELREAIEVYELGKPLK